MAEKGFARDILVRPYFFDGKILFVLLRHFFAKITLDGVELVGVGWLFHFGSLTLVGFSVNF